MATAQAIRTGISAVRFGGEVASVAMRDDEWSKFGELSYKAMDRLTVLFEHFCSSGGADLPRTALRWLTPTKEEPERVNYGAFEAHGVVVRGRLASNREGTIFHVTEIEIDEPVDPIDPAEDEPHEERIQLSLPFISEKNPWSSPDEK
ncbi:hypothetical protein [Hyphomonas sp. UBA2515]|jgi:hypothetical protein|uniref:hypothetical protein n=1 Tax=Hyphomonas sp. UBA2515 TaxID=1946618 RepID=UPI0025BCB520|nr:hypothetical protein [Hyphomonas sp. UBA2515]|tara:strand:- start:1257 stop:1700 length:444 start_codon:yes stop_codon:yes gene_type:complete